MDIQQSQVLSIKNIQVSEEGCAEPIFQKNWSEVNDCDIELVWKKKILNKVESY